MMSADKEMVEYPLKEVLQSIDAKIDGISGKLDALSTRISKTENTLSFHSGIFKALGIVSAVVAVVIAAVIRVW